MDDPVDDEVRHAANVMLTRAAVDAHSGKLGPAALSLIDAVAAIVIHAHKHNGTDGPLWARHYAHHLIDQVEHHTGGAK